MGTDRIPAPKPGLYPGTQMATYLAWDAWSSSDLKALLQGPEYAWWYRNERKDEPSNESDFGSLAHLALLEPDRWPPKDVAWIAGPYNCNPGRREKADAEARGFRVQKPEVRARVEALVKRCHEDPLMAALLAHSEGMREVSAVARCPETGLLVKARCDLAVPAILTIADLKTTTVGTDRDSFRRQSKQRGYWLSASHYQDVFTQATGTAFETYLWLAVAQDVPFVPRIYQLDPVTAAAGEDLMRYLRRQAAHHTETGVWRDESRKVQTYGLSKNDLDEIREVLEQEAATA